MTAWICLLAYLPAVLWLARDNARRIAQDRRIYHVLNGSLHLAAAGLAWWLAGWKAAAALLLMVRVVFDTALNLWRGLPVGYVTPKPVSLVDRLEQAVFGRDGYTPKIIYLFSCLVLAIS